MILSCRFITLLCLLVTSNLSIAGGPLVLEGSDGNTPVTYQNPTVTIHPDTGPLGSLSNDAADELMRDAFSLWNNVDTAIINLILDNTDRINVDINISNFTDFLPNTSGTELNADDGLNPVAYDSNGEIIDAFFGAGQSDFTIGFAASIFNLRSDFYIEGYAVINGKDLGLTDTTFKLLIAHEIGHLIGLDHSQGNINNQETDFGFPKICQTATQDKYPIMYPFVCRDEVSLHSDDISAVSALYPAANFDSSFGVIEGRFVDELSEAIIGANIWAENTSTGEVVSIVSDYLDEGNGFYKLHVTPGNYTLHANSINQLFNGGSSVGPHASTLSDKSFVAPHPITEVTLTTDGNDEIITVSADNNQLINFSSAGKIVTLSSGGGGSSAFSGILSALFFGLLLVSRRFDYTGKTVTRH